MRASILVLLLPLAAASGANRIVCITADNSSYANNAEGYERARAAQDLAANPAPIAKATFQVGGALAACLSNVANGDELVLIAHGTPGILTWDDGEGNVTDYPDFRSLNLPASFANLSNVSVTVASSRSCSANGTQVSVCAALLSTMNGARQNTGNVCKGFDTVAANFYVIDVGAADPNNPPNADETAAAQQCAALDLFNNDNSVWGSWANNPPEVRAPDATPNQFTALQDLIAACPLAHGKVQASKLILLPPMSVTTKLPAAQCAP